MPPPATPPIQRKHTLGRHHQSKWKQLASKVGPATTTPPNYAANPLMHNAILKRESGAGWTAVVTQQRQAAARQAAVQGNRNSIRETRSPDASFVSVSF